MAPPSDAAATGGPAQASNEVGTEPTISRRAVECVVAVLLAGLAGLALWDSYWRGAGWSGGPQSGFFPARVAWLGLAASAFVFINALRTPDRPFATLRQLLQVARILLPLVAYVAAIRYLGIYVSSALFMTYFILANGTLKWWWALAMSVGVSLLLFWIFEIRFSVLLPKGPLEDWLGY
ncbi:MAG: tripartite tricarboxylate transporter TctB family protein [Bauldia sp.]